MDAGSSLELGAGKPTLAVRVIDFGGLRVRGARIEGFTVDAGANGRVELGEARVGKVQLSSQARLSASKSRIGELAMAGEAQAVLEECEVDTLTLRLEQVGVELAGLRSDEPVDWSFDGVRGYRVELRQCRVRRYAVEVGAGTRVEISDSPRVAILVEIGREVSSFDDLKTGRHEETLVTNRTAGISIRLQNVGVEEWGLRALNESVLNARRSQIGRAESRQRARMVLQDCEVAGVLTAADRSLLELEGCRVTGRAVLQTVGNGRMAITRCRVDEAALLRGYDAGLFEVWETARVPRPLMHDHARILLQGREWKLDK